tara:strand:+ start:447 stop:650 length:204 start_codon:yes stop_codon:yes gene_type:complete
MANTRKKNTANKADTSTNDTDKASLEAQMEKFLASGGEVQKIASGISGQVQTTGPRHITLGKRHQAT